MHDDVEVALLRAIEKRSRVVWIGCLPSQEDAEVLEKQLHALVPDAVRIKVLPFMMDKQRKNYPADAKHRGCAVISCPDMVIAQQALRDLYGLDWAKGKRTVSGAAVKFPADWGEDLTVLDEDRAASKAKEEARVLRAAHQKRRRGRVNQAHRDSVRAAIEDIDAPGGPGISAAYRPIIACQGASKEALEAWVRDIAWDTMPPDCQPGLSFKGPSNKRQVERTLRKRLQVASFGVLLQQLLDGGATPRPRARRPLVVDFGSGSGNLVLPLAHLMPGVDFLSIDMKAEPIRLLETRVAGAGLPNVRGTVGTIEGYTGECDVVFALHACGNATDYALLQAQRCRAAFVVSPCCVGKLKYSANLASSISAGRTARGVADTEVMARVQQQFAQRAAEGAETRQALPGAGPALAGTAPAAETGTPAGPPDAPLPGLDDAPLRVTAAGAAVPDAVPADSDAQGGDVSGSAAVRPGAPQGEWSAGAEPSAAQGSGESAAQEAGGSDEAAEGEAEARSAAAKAARPAPAGELLAHLATLQGEGSADFLLQHPRSAWLRGSLTSPEEQFCLIATAADISHDKNHTYAETAVLAKANVELDRTMAAREQNYKAELVKLLQPELTFKNDVIVGVPSESVGDRFHWPWGSNEKA